MTGRRSHGRLSALNGVVHQGKDRPAQAGPARVSLASKRGVLRLTLPQPPRHPSPLQRKILLKPLPRFLGKPAI